MTFINLLDIPQNQDLTSKNYWTNVSDSSKVLQYSNGTKDLPKSNLTQTSLKHHIYVQPSDHSIVLYGNVSKEWDPVIGQNTSNRIKQEAVT